MPREKNLRLKYEGLQDRASKLYPEKYTVDALISTVLGTR